MSKTRCGWVRPRLPLMAGDELSGAERLHVQRHLIGCPDCRGHLSALRNALGVLHASASMPPAPGRPDFPSIWPDLARQLRESRHAAPSSWSWPRVMAWPAIGVSLGVLAVALMMIPGPSTPRVREQPAPGLLVDVNKAPAMPTTPAPAPSPRVVKSAPQPQPLLVTKTKESPASPAETSPSSARNASDHERTGSASSETREVQPTR